VLEAVGLTPIEERTYRTLVRARSMTPADLRSRLGLTAEQADAVFGSLAAKGLVTSTTGPAKRLVAAPVEVAGEALLLRRLQELQAARLEFTRIAADYRLAVGQTSVDEMIEIAPNEAVPTLFEQLQRQANTEVWTITTPPYAVPSDENSVEIERLASGVSYLGLYTQAALEEPGALEMIRRYVDAGEQARMQPNLSLKMAVFDRELALVPIVGGRGTGVLSDSLIVRPCSLLDALIELFERLWLSAVPLDPLLFDASASSGRKRGSRGIAPQEARLLALLLAGMTDDAIGRQLGLARRTVVRRVHELMARAKATNRLQLILRAAQLGWIDVSGAAPPAETWRMPETPLPRLGARALTPSAGANSDASPRGRTPSVLHRDPLPSLPSLPS
jgi:DNA-binding CsgD family transcriptional regulator/DNA-binding MarR family transcriptional regulator